MENYYVEAQKDIYFVPGVSLDAGTGICTLTGSSYLSDTVKFYSPVMSWLIQYMTEIRGPLTFNFRLTYFNTSTGKSFIEILMLLKQYERDGGEVAINWYVYDDEDLVEEIEDFGIQTDLKINIILVDEENG